MDIQYKTLSDKIITAEQAEIMLHNKEYLENGEVKIIEKKLFSEIQWITYYKDFQETDEEIFDKYKNIITVTSIFIKSRDFKTYAPYIIESKETFWREGKIFNDQLITIKKLIDPTGRIGAWERFNRELATTDFGYRAVGKIFYFGSKDDDYPYGIPYLSTSYNGYGTPFETATFDPGISDDDQDIELFDRDKTSEHLNNYSQEIIEWFLNDEFLPPLSF